VALFDSNSNLGARLRVIRKQGRYAILLLASTWKEFRVSGPGCLCGMPSTRQPQCNGALSGLDLSGLGFPTRDTETALAPQRSFPTESFPE